MEFQTFLLFFLLLWERGKSYRLLDQISGSVKGGEANYYTLKQKTITLICLVSDEGDADLYVDYTSVTKTPDSETHRYLATSTGLDVVTVMYDTSYGESLSIGVHGYIAQNESSYRLYIVTPSEEDISDHQVWELDPESKTQRLIIDVDPLWMANDPKLHRMLEMLSSTGYVTSHNQLTSYLIIIKDWILWFIVNFLHIAVEILA